VPTAPPVVVPPVPTPVPPAPVVTTPGEVKMTIYDTFYGWPDNTPANSSILSTGGQAGGTGTFNDPITMATGYVLVNGKPKLDYPMGTKFYIPNERKYFVVADECGDLPNPESKACHKSGHPPYPQLDIWVGGVGAAYGPVTKCEEAHTRVNVAIMNPGPNYLVVPGAIYNGSCGAQYGDTIQ